MTTPESRDLGVVVADLGDPGLQATIDPAGSALGIALHCPALHGSSRSTITTSQGEPHRDNGR